MNAGKLTCKIVLQSPSGTQDAAGERITTWTDQFTVYARIRTLTTRETMAAGQRNSSTTNMIEFPYATSYAAMTSDWRVKYGTRFFMIEAVINVDEANRQLQLACSESSRTE